jgi:thioredoxin 1
LFGLIILSSSILNKKNEDDQSEEKGVISDMEILDVTRENFEEEVLKADRKVLVDFYADWCGPCKMLAPIVEEVASEHEDLKVVRINIDNEESIAMDYQIMSIPTLVLIKDGKEVDRVIGYVQKKVIETMIER